MDQKLKSEIVAAYYGEFYGVEFFSYLESTADSALEKRLWGLLVEVEREIAKRLLPIILSESGADESMEHEQRHRGKEAAARFRSEGVPTAAERFGLVVENCISQYSEIYERCPKDWKSRVYDLVNHEIIQKDVFLDLAKGKMPDLAPITGFLKSLRSHQLN